MNKLKKIWQWLVKSSADAKKWSLTIKSILYAIIPTAVYFLGLVHIQIGSDALTEVVNMIAELIVVIGGVITAISFTWGLIRKIETTLTGENKVVTSWNGEY